MFILQYMCSVLQCAGNVHVQFPIDFLQSVAKDSARKMRNRRGRGVQVAKTNCRCARKIIMARNLLR